MQSSIIQPQVTAILEALYADAAARDPLAHQQARDLAGKDFYHGMGDAYMAIGPEFGQLLYSLVRTSRARTIVEFGTSFGISTIYLAAGLRDNGGGRLITTEFVGKKAERAARNLADAGLAEFVEFRVGDALETLAEPSPEIDLVFLDGAKDLYLGVLKLLEPGLHSGSIVASDNTDHEGLGSFLSHLRDPANGYTSAGIFTAGHRGKAHEISVRN